jgi:hypothetical protein
VKLTLDCALTFELSGLQRNSGLANLLARGQITKLEKPLEALICEQYGLQANPDYPIAAISAAADDIDVGTAYWLRADAVNLVLQRDCLSLGVPVPLIVKLEHVDLMVASLNLHFAQDSLAFFIGKSGAWYLRANQIQQIKTTLPSVAADKNIHQFMPQGIDSAKWIAMLNEVQMLLYEHQANLARESSGDVAVNSIWLSGGGVMPLSKPISNDTSLIIANSAFYQGLAKWLDVAYQTVPDNLDQILKSAAKHVRLQLPQINNLDEICFQSLLSALKNKTIKQLTLNLGFYEKSLTVIIKPIDTYKFWRKTLPVMHYLK